MLEQLIDAGRKLPESHRPPIGDIGDLLAGLVYLVEHGNLDVPEGAPESAAQPTPEAQRVQTLEAELAAAVAKEAPAPVAAAPGVLPPPAQPSTQVDTPAINADVPAQVDPPAAAPAEPPPAAPTTPAV